MGSRNVSGVWWGSGFKVWGLGVGVWGAAFAGFQGFGVSGCRVRGVGL